MCKRSNIIFESVRKFEDARLNVPKTIDDLIVNRINELGDYARNDVAYRLLYRTNKLSFPKGFDRKLSTLFLMKVTNDVRLVVSCDDDPIFDQKIITLYRIANKQNDTEMFNEVAKELYG